MDIAFKESKIGYAKAEVDAYIINMQYLIDELQFKDISLERQLDEVNLKALEIKKNAVCKAKKIIEKSDCRYDGLNDEAMAAFRKLVSIRININQFIQSNLHEIPDNEISYFDQKLDAGETDLDLTIKYLRSLKFNLGGEPLDIQ